MSACYVWVEVTVPDMSKLAEYMQKVPGTIEKYGGKYLIRAGDVDVLEGNIGAHPLKVLIEFSDKEAALAWYHSPEYHAIHAIRTENSQGNIMLVAGV